MSFIARILGFIVGLKFGGFWGALFGFWLGSKIDKKLKIGESSNEAKQKVFYDNTFLVMGHIAKADGKVSQQEIHQATKVMHRLNLNDEQMARAKTLFNQGKSDDFNLSDTLVNFRNTIGSRNRMAILFLEFQISAALADGHIDANEQIILLQVSNAIGIPRVLFDQLIMMVSAGQQFNGGNFGGQSTQNQPPSQSQLSQAYQILGITQSDSDATIKRAYRKLLSQNHPDKLQSKGLPDEMLKVAADKTHTIKQAYELIKSNRNIK